jgi:RHS repeat-associated protein
LQPSPSVSPSPSLVPSPLPSCSPDNKKKDQHPDCNNGTGNNKQTGQVAGVTTEASATPSPTTITAAEPSPSASVEPSPSVVPSPESSPTLAPENAAPVAIAEAEQPPQRNELAKTELAYDGNGRRLISTYYPGSSQPGKKTEFTFDRLDPIGEHYMWNGQRQNIYRTTHAPITRPTQPAERQLAQYRLDVDHQGTDLAFFQDFKSEQDPNGTLYWYHHDGEGNIAATTKHSGQSDHTYRYDEYGWILPDNGTSNHNGGGPAGVDSRGASGWDIPHNQYTLTQKHQDPHIGLVNFGARYYDAEVGVWLTQDSYRGELPNPQSLHRYMYNAASPVNYKDPYGFLYILIDISQAKMYVYDKKGGTLQNEWNVKVGDATKPGSYELFEWEDHPTNVSAAAIGFPGDVVGGTDQPWSETDTDNPFGPYAGILRDKQTGQVVHTNVHGRAAGLTDDPWQCGGGEYKCKFGGAGCIALSNENITKLAKDLSWGEDGRVVHDVDIVGKKPTEEEYRQQQNAQNNQSTPSRNPLKRFFRWIGSFF